MRGHNFIQCVSAVPVWCVYAGRDSCTTWLTLVCLCDSDPLCERLCGLHARGRPCARMLWHPRGWLADPRLLSVARSVRNPAGVPNNPPDIIATEQRDAARRSSQRKHRASHTAIKGKNTSQGTGCPEQGPLTKQEACSRACVVPC